MIKHIVFWKLKSDLTGAAREQTIRRITEGFAAMRGQIPGMRHIEVGVDFSAGDDSAHLVLYAEFESRAALDGYQTHPLHLAMMPVVREVRTERRVGDYEV